MKPHSLANTSRVRHRQRIWLSTAPKKRQSRGSKEPGGSSLSRDSCSGRHQTGTKPGEHGELPEQVAARSERLYEETTVPSGHETQSERAANCRAGERVVSLEVEVGDFGVINARTNFLLVEGIYGS